MASGERGIDAPSHKECFGRGGSGPVAALFGEDYMKFVNKPTAVEARFEAGGAARPRRFTWEKTWLDVSDVGRQWIVAFCKNGRSLLY
jgi:hypothetical protein